MLEKKKRVKRTERVKRVRESSSKEVKLEHRADNVRTPQPCDEDPRQSTPGEDSEKDNRAELELWQFKEPHQGHQGQHC